VHPSVALQLRQLVLLFLHLALQLRQLVLLFLHLALQLRQLVLPLRWTCSMSTACSSAAFLASSISVILLFSLNIR
jgi:hypothetical protein